MEPITTYYKCACANCGEVMEYLASQAGEIVQCPKCGEKSQLPEPPKLIMIEVFGPPVPEFKNCEVCGTRRNFWTILCPVCEKARKQKAIQTRILVSVAVALVLVLGGAGARLFWLSKQPPPPSGLVTATESTSPIIPNPPSPRILIEQPVPRTAKSLKDLKAGRFTLEKRRGDDLAIAVGDVENISENVHHQIRVNLDLLDKTGAKIGSMSSYSSELGPHQSWHIIETVTDTNTMSIRFAGFKEDDY